MEKRKYNKKIEQTHEHISPPRSKKYATSNIVKEQTIKINTNKYLMRILGCKAVELVRYDYLANKWIVLCFDGIEGVKVI